MAEDLGFDSLQGQEIFLFSITFRPVLGPTHFPTQLIADAVFSGVMRQGREAGHSPYFSAEVKKLPIYTSTPPYVFMA
jgi:hypothetical protein